jgi:phage FluMu protein Com
MINKTGDIQKILTVASTAEDFELLKEKIIKENQLVRCIRCGKLLCKTTDDSMISIKRKDVDLVAKVSKLTIACPVCREVNTLKCGEGN